MRIIVTGVGGQLGTDVVKELEQQKHQVLGVGHKELDITDESKVKEVLDGFKPEAIIHCAAYTAVDAAEEDTETAFRVNVLGTRYLAQGCQKHNAKLIYISTDYVFSGDGDQPWEVTDSLAPCNQYGKTKMLGEKEVMGQINSYFIVRTSWVIGATGKNFVKTMLTLGRTREEISVVNDQYGSPTFTKDLARLLAQMVVTKKYGIYHACNQGCCTWYELAKKVFELTEIPIHLKAITSDDYPMKAIRPKNSRLSMQALKDNGFQLLPNWEVSLKEYLNEIE